MSDAQFGVLISALVTVLGSLIGMLRWSVNRITKALDDNTSSNLEDSKAKIALAEKLAVFATKLDSVTSFVQEHTPVRGVNVDEHLRRVEAAKREARKTPREISVPYYYGPERKPKGK